MGGQVVGFTNVAVGTHAALWNNNGMIDLNPPTATGSRANGTSGTQQVGRVAFNEPSGMLQSTATGVDLRGDIFGVANDSSGQYYAVEWVPDVPLPEPSTIIALAGGAAAVLLRRRRV